MMTATGTNNEPASRSCIDIAGCLEAVDMYAPDFHRDRGDVPVLQQTPEIVSLGEYFWARGMKTGEWLLGSGLLLIMLLAGTLMVANGVKNVYEYQRAQPVVHTGLPPDRPKTDILGRDNGQPTILLNAEGLDTWFEPSPYPLPYNWVESNLLVYALLSGAMFFSRLGSVHCFQRARRIKTGVPINYADAAHLSAQESLVRASQEPARESLVRASALPPVPPGVLLRSLGPAQETPPEQLVRAAGNTE